ncbi:MAG: GIY-YIG nuclease family protein [Dokdonella sp.]|nr:GIY-YIG nuclease family protein [Dokdonella sp.]
MSSCTPDFTADLPRALAAPARGMVPSAGTGAMTHDTVRARGAATTQQQENGMLDMSAQSLTTPMPGAADSQSHAIGDGVTDADRPAASGWRTLRNGRCFVYVLPCRESDTIKVGYARDPLVRLHALHARYFEFFDLDRALLVETDYVRDAREIERRLKQALADDAVTAPLSVREAAGGRTEWFGGAWSRAVALSERICEEDGYLLHPQLSAWLRVRWFRDAALYDWSQQALRQIEFLSFNGAPDTAQKLHRELKNALDACDAVGLRLEGKVPGAVLAWYRSGARAFG